jgi:hypothetical protein
VLWCPPRFPDRPARGLWCTNRDAQSFAAEVLDFEEESDEDLVSVEDFDVSELLDEPSVEDEEEFSLFSRARLRVP